MINIKKTAIVLLAIFLAVSTYSQQQPVKWKFFAKKVADKQYELHIIAIIDSGWHIYSSCQPQEAIGLPTTIKIYTNPLILLIGNFKEKGNLIKVFNKELETEEHQYSQKVDFIRLVNLKVNAKTSVNGSIEFMACTDERCLPPQTVTFRLPLD
jgi:hypothetical protein